MPQADEAGGSEAAAEAALVAAKEELEDQPAVAAVDYDYVRSYTSNDPRYDKQYNLTQTGFDDAWRTERGDGALIGVVDSGIAQNHPPTPKARSPASTTSLAMTTRRRTGTVTAPPSRGWQRR